MEEKNIKKETAKILKEAGMNASFTGYKYWKIAMYGIFMNECNADRKGIFSYISKKCKVKISSIERSMRYSVDNIDASTYFNTNYKVTTSSFLVLLLEKLEEEAGISVS